MKGFRPKNPRLRLISVNNDDRENRPLYAGKVVVKKANHYGGSDQISLPLIAWMARDSR